MEDPFSGEERIYAPIFPTERWTRLVIQKMQSGYTLVVTEQSTRLFRPGTGFEPCPAQVAKLLLREGKVRQVGNRGKGAEYSLAPEPAVLAQALVPGEPIDGHQPITPQRRR